MSYQINIEKNNYIEIINPLKTKHFFNINISHTQLQLK